MRVQRQRNAGGASSFLKILISLVLLVAVAFMLAWVWHTTQQSALSDGGLGAREPAAVSSQQSPEPQEAVVLPAKERSRPVEPEPVGDESDSASGNPPPSTEPPAQFSGALRESAPVDNTYFDDAIFIGDSISTGIPLYHVADNAAVVAMTGLSLANINDRPAIDVGEEERVTVLEACMLHPGRKKVYIMLGGNSLDLPMESFIAGYKTFLDSLRELYPGAVFYLQSITPVVEGYQNEIIPGIDNAKIDAYNREIMDLAAREKAYYLDVASALKDENGALPPEASPTDGMHFTPEYYIKWFEYLKEHTAEGVK